MILADKIIHLRKKHHMTQEDLAERLNVSRQSVSKWEGAQSTPDLNKILKLSKVFGVTTDYLLNDEHVSDEIEEVELPDEEWVSVSLETANQYLEDQAEFAHRIGLAVVFLISSAIPIVVLTTPAIQNMIPENVGQALGVSLLFLLVAIGVGLLIFASMRMHSYEFLDDQPFELEFGVRGFLEKEKETYHPVYTRQLAFGVALIITSVIPLVVINLAFQRFAEANNGYIIGIFLAIVSLAIYMLITSGIFWGSFSTLLESQNQKGDGDEMEDRLAGIYWPLITALFLGYSFITQDWGRSWIVWPVASMIFAAISGLFNFNNQNRE